MDLIEIGKSYKWVKCKYSSPWIGIRLDHRFGNCYNYLVVFDRNGHPVRKRIIKQYNHDWMIDIPYKTHLINKDWI